MTIEATASFYLDKIEFINGYKTLRTKKTITTKIPVLLVSTAPTLRSMNGCKLESKTDSLIKPHLVAHHLNINYASWAKLSLSFNHFINADTPYTRGNCKNFCFSGITHSQLRLTNN